MPAISIQTKKRNVIQNILLAWFAKHKRSLPWRNTTQGKRNPYHVWLAEIMLQQTQVATVIPYFERWLQKFPTLESLAAASLDEVLKQWEGLGYYSRARNFYKAAQQVVGERNGVVPNTVAGLLELAGVGRYTAGAIASLAFGADAPILDGNVKRVWSRLFALPDNDADVLWRISETLLPAGNAGEFNEALMDFGATLCTPRKPNCDVCPLQKQCAAYAQSKPEQYPIKENKKPVPHKNIGTAVLRNKQNAVLMAQRPTQGLLGGLWEFISGEIDVTNIGLPLLGNGASQAVAEMVRAQTGLKVEINDTDFIGAVKHAFTHFKITRHVFLLKSERKSQPSANMRWVPLDQVHELALTRSDQKILVLVQQQLD